MKLSIKFDDGRPMVIEGVKSFVVNGSDESYVDNTPSFIKKKIDVINEDNQSN